MGGGRGGGSRAGLAWRGATSCAHKPLHRRTRLARDLYKVSRCPVLRTSLFTGGLRLDHLCAWHVFSSSRDTHLIDRPRCIRPPLSSKPQRNTAAPFNSASCDSTRGFGIATHYSCIQVLLFRSKAATVTRTRQMNRS